MSSQLKINKPIMTTQKKPKNKFFSFLTSLCGRQSVVDPIESSSKQKKKCRTHVQKKPRLTFMIDRVLIKLSRKNVAQQQFMDNQILTFNLQKYLAGRLSGCQIVLISGQFSNYFSQKMAYPIYLLQKELDYCSKDTNQILINNNKMFRMRFNVVDAAIVQLYFGQSQIGNTNKLFPNDEQSKSEIDKIQKILKFYYKKISNFVFICSKDLNLQQIHSLFLVFRQHYLFQVQRVKMTQKLICNIVYISCHANFLKIDNSCLGDFLFEKIQNLIRPHYQFQQKYQRRKSIKTQQIIRQSKQIGKEKLKIQIKMSKIHDLLKKLLAINLHIEVATTIGQILASSQKKNDCLTSFLQIMSNRSKQARSLVNQFKDQDFYNFQQEKDVRLSSQFTPMFQCEFLSQKIISESVPFNSEMKSYSEKHSQFQDFNND